MIWHVFAAIWVEFGRIPSPSGILDRLDKDAIESMKGLASAAARKLLPEPASVVFFDCARAER